MALLDQGMTILALFPRGFGFDVMSAPLVSEPGFISRQVTQARRFYFGRDDSASAAGLEVTGGGWELVASDYVVDRDSFPWLALEFVADGKGWLEIGGARHALCRGVVFAYGGGVRHRIETDPGERLSKYYLNFSGREAADRLSALGLGPGCCRTVGNAGELEAMFGSFIDEGLAARPQAPEIVALQLRILLLKMKDGGAEAHDAGGRARLCLNRCLGVMDRDYLRFRTVEEAAVVCHVSVGHLTRLFLRFGHGSPHRYLTRRKMFHAAELLDAGGLLVREVADRLGVDPFQFSRVFKRVHGISPSEFVARNRRPGS